MLNILYTNYLQLRLSKKLLASAMMLSLMAGCNSTQGIRQDQAKREPKTLGAQATFSQWPAELWWQSFNDPLLNHLIDQALRDNPNVVIAAKRLESANAYASAAKSAIYPQVDGSLVVSCQRLPENSFYPPPYGGSYQNIANGSLNAISGEPVCICCPIWTLRFANWPAAGAVISHRSLAR